MFKVAHKTLIIISGFVWLCVGLFLLPFGLHLLMDCLQIPEGYYPLLKPVSSILNSRENGVILLIALGLFIGFVKGRIVLKRAAERQVKRIICQPSPVYISSIYSLKYYLLLGSMIFLGVSIKYFGVPSDIRGFVDVAIGSALINGAVCFFRLSQALREAKNVLK